LVEADTHACQPIKYIHLTPVRPKDKRKPIAAQRERELTRYRWSSHGAYAGVPGASVPSWLSLEWLTYFGATSGAARAAYRREIARMFGRVVPSPWEDLRHGLVLGGEALWDKACRILEKSEGKEQIRQRRRAERDRVSRKIEKLVEREPDRRVRIGLRVRLGGQRMTEIAKEYGYSDGSGVHQVVKRLETKAGKDPELSEHLKALTEKASDVKNCPPARIGRAILGKYCAVCQLSRVDPSPIIRIRNVRELPFLPHPEELFVEIDNGHAVTFGCLAGTLISIHELLRRGSRSASSAATSAHTSATESPRGLCASSSTRSVPATRSKRNSSSSV
jgi:hypothetical protein